MIRKKMPSTVSFLKYLGFLLMQYSFNIYFGNGNSLTADYLQYFPPWFSLDLSMLMREEGSIFSAVFFSIAYLSSCLFYKFFRLTRIILIAIL